MTESIRVGLPQTQSLMLDDTLFPEVLAGLVTMTVRVGYRDVVLGPLRFKATHGGYLPLVVNVNKVTQGKLSEVSDEHAKTLGFRDAVALFVDLRRFYPKIVGASPVTIVEFDRISR